MISPACHSGNVLGAQRFHTRQLNDIGTTDASEAKLTIVVASADIHGAVRCKHAVKAQQIPQPTGEHNGMVAAACNLDDASRDDGDVRGTRGQYVANGAWYRQLTLGIVSKRIQRVIICEAIVSKETKMDGIPASTNDEHELLPLKALWTRCPRRASTTFGS